MRPDDRVCVLVGRMPWEPLLPGRRCASRTHGHVSARTASGMVDQGSFEWLRGEKTSRKGKVEEFNEPAIRAVRRREWKKRASAGVDVMQLVP